MVSLLVVILGVILATLPVGSPDTCGAGDERANSTSTGRNKIINLLALVPYPDARTVNTSNYGNSPANVVIPAICLATQHINDREDVLNGYTIRIIGADSGCPLWLNSIVHLTEHVFGSGQNVAAVIGPACAMASQRVGSFAALGVQRSDGKPSLLQIGSTSSPSLSKDAFSNTFRVTSSMAYVNSFLKLISVRGWTRFAALYQPNSFFLSLFQQFSDKTSDDQLVYSAGLYERADFPLEEIREQRVRVVFMFVEKGFASKVLCVAKQLHMTYPTFQWIFHSRTADQIVQEYPVSVTYKDKPYTCTKEEMRKAARGVILNVYSLEKSDNTSTVANLSFDSYKEQYKVEHEKFAVKLENQSYGVVNETQFSNAYYDAVWALAIAMNQSLLTLSKSGYELADYNYREGNATEIIRTELLKTKFNGMSGHIEFDQTTRDNMGIAIELLQIQPDVNESSGAVRIGYYRHFLNDNLELGPHATLWIDSSEFEVVYVGWSNARTYGLLFTTLLVLVVTVSLHLANIFLGQHRSMKATSTRLNHLIFSGCYLYIFGATSYVCFESILVNSIRTFTEQDFILYSVNCNMYVWCCMLGYTLIFGTVCGKTWRIYRIFSHFRRPHNILIADKSLVAFVSGMMLVDLVLLTVISYTDPWLLRQTEEFDGEKINMYVHCGASGIPTVFVIMVLYKAAQSVLVVMLALLTRKVSRGEYKSTKSLNALVYILILLTGLSSVLYVALSNSRLGRDLLLFFVLVIFVVLCDIFLFVPPVWPVVKKKKDEFVGFVSSSKEKETGPLSPRHRRNRVVFQIA